MCVTALVSIFSGVAFAYSWTYRDLYRFWTIVDDFGTVRSSVRLSVKIGTISMPLGVGSVTPFILPEYFVYVWATVNNMGEFCYSETSGWETSNANTKYGALVNVKTRCGVSARVTKDIRALDFKPGIATSGTFQEPSDLSKIYPDIDLPILKEMNISDSIFDNAKIYVGIGTSNEIIQYQQIYEVGRGVIP